MTTYRSHSLGQCVRVPVPHWPWEVFGHIDRLLPGEEVAIKTHIGTFDVHKDDVEIVSEAERRQWIKLVKKRREERVIKTPARKGDP